MAIGEPGKQKADGTREPLWALGLMSGTSMDGIDLALIRTDGETVAETGPSHTVPYGEDFAARLNNILGGKGDVAGVERELTLAHVAAIKTFLKESGFAGEIDIVGFHGHTILHQPDKKKTWQIGDGQLLANETGLPVINDLRGNDVAAGGQGAPLASLYHAALATALERPLAVLNIGGVSNVTWIGPGENELLAFDTGPGGAQLDEWVKEQTGAPYDEDGALSRSGAVDEAAVKRFLENPYFAAQPPKSLDRIDFSKDAVDGMSAADGAATLTRFSCAAIARGAAFLPIPPTRWLVTGGGRKNSFMLAELARLLGTDVSPVESVGWDGDALEAQAFAYLAARSLDGKHITLPGTTGAPRPMTGGVLHRPT